MQGNHRDPTGKNITGELATVKAVRSVRWGAEGKGRVAYLASGLPDDCLGHARLPALADVFAAQPLPIAWEI